MRFRRVHLSLLGSLVAIGPFACGDDAGGGPGETAASSGDPDAPATSSTSDAGTADSTGFTPETGADSPDSTAAETSSGSDSSTGSDGSSGSGTETGGMAELSDAIVLLDLDGAFAPGSVHRLRVTPDGVEPLTLVSPDDTTTWRSFHELPDHSLVLESTDDTGTHFWVSSVDDPIPVPVPLSDGFDDGEYRAFSTVPDRNAILFWDEPTATFTLGDFTGGTPQTDIVAVGADMGPGSGLFSTRWMDPLGRYVVYAPTPDVADSSLLARASLLDPNPATVELFGVPPLGAQAACWGFTPDGDGIFMTSDDELYHVDFSEDVAAVPLPMHAGEEYEDVQPATSRRGVTASRNGSFYWLGIGDDGMPQAPVHLFDVGIGDLAEVVWSPDGRWAGFNWRQTRFLPDDGYKVGVVHFSEQGIPGPMQELAVEADIPGGFGIFGIHFDELSPGHFYTWTIAFEQDHGEIVRYTLDDAGIGPAQTVLSNSAVGVPKHIYDISHDGWVLARVVGPTDVLQMVDGSGAVPGPPVTVSAPLPDGLGAHVGRFSPDGQYVGYLEYSYGTAPNNFALVLRDDPGALVTRVDVGDVQPWWSFIAP